jgi:hypothetical protein
MNWSDITSGYGSQSFRPIGGLLGLNLGNMQQQLPPQFAQLFGNGGMQQFPQYGGNTRSAQMMNNYMGGLLSRRTPYMPPQMPARQQPAAAPASAAPAQSTNGTVGYYSGWGPSAEIPGWTPSMIGQSWSGGA